MTTSARRIDHLVLAVHDLDGAAAFCERLGFQVGARNRHPWGTENRLVQFRSSFLELITVGKDAEITPHGPRVFSFGAFVRDYLARREGLAMLVLDSFDARQDAVRFAEAGIGDYEPFFFERSGRRPDGSATHVAFTLAFANDPRLPETSFFVCQQHFPEAFWNPDLQSHANGAMDVSAVTLSVDNPPLHARFLAAFTGVAPGGEELFFAFKNEGKLQVVAGEEASGFTAFRVRVPDLTVVKRRLREEEIAFHEAQDHLAVLSRQLGVMVQFGQG
jgi:hypothetical protein